MRTTLIHSPEMEQLREREKTKRARKGLLIFFAMLIPLSIAGYALALTSELFVIFLMWTPGIASILTRIVLKEGKKDISLKLGFTQGIKTIPIALLLPVLIGSIAYGIAWATGLVQFAAPEGATNGSVHSAFMSAIIMQMTVGTLIGLITSTGEELGWRGYMTTRLVDAKTPFPLLTSGIIWGLWHLPVLILGNYNSGPNLVLSIVFFMISVSSFGYILGRIRLSSGSVWPAVFLHAAWNAIIQDAFDAFSHGERAMIWTGESGILVAACLMLTAWLVSRKPIRVN